MALETSLGTQALVREITVGERAGFHTGEHLAKAKQQAIERGLNKVFIVDMDSHHYDTQNWPEIIKYIEDPVLRHRAEQGYKLSGAGGGILYSDPVLQNREGRIIRAWKRRSEPAPPGTPYDV